MRYHVRTSLFCSPKSSFGVWCAPVTASLYCLTLALTTLPSMRPESPNSKERRFITNINSKVPSAARGRGSLPPRRGRTPTFDHAPRGSHLPKLSRTPEWNSKFVQLMMRAILSSGVCSGMCEENCTCTAPRRAVHPGRVCRCEEPPSVLAPRVVVYTKGFIRPL